MLATALILMGTLAADPIPVVVSTDCGCEMDDQWALALMLLSPSIDVRAILAAHSPAFTNPAAERTAKVCRSLVKFLPITKKPDVLTGSSHKLVDDKTPKPNEAVDRLLAESKGFTPEKRLTVVMIGPATDVASALLVDPTLADRIAIVAMAFDDWEKGNDPYNVANDVAAWRIVIDSPVPLTVSDGAVSLKHLLLTRAEARAKLGKSGPIAVDMLGVLDGWLTHSEQLAIKVTGKPDAWPVWDCGPVAVLLGFATVEARPRPKLRDDRTFDHDHAKGTIRWVTSIDGDKLWDDFAAKLKTTR